jgi:hypothetical protein
MLNTALQYLGFTALALALFALVYVLAMFHRGSRKSTHIWKKEADTDDLPKSGKDNIDR